MHNLSNLSKKSKKYGLFKTNHNVVQLHACVESLKCTDTDQQANLLPNVEVAGLLDKCAIDRLRVLI